MGNFCDLGGWNVTFGVDLCSPALLCEFRSAAGKMTLVNGRSIKSATAKEFPQKNGAELRLKDFSYFPVHSFLPEVFEIFPDNATWCTPGRFHGKKLHRNVL